MDGEAVIVMEQGFGLHNSIVKKGKGLVHILIGIQAFLVFIRSSISFGDTGSSTPINFDEVFVSAHGL